MNQTAEYMGVLVAFLIACGLAAAMLFLNAVLGPKKKSNPTKLEPFECGVRPFDVPMGRLSVQFYLFAMLFILFDVEIVWLFPWAVLLKHLGWFGLVEMFSFMAIFGLAFIYAWKKGAMTWQG